MATQISRRNLFRLKPTEAVQLLRERRDETSEAAMPVYFRPPGALADEADFLTACERCGKCAEACPHGVIEKLGPVAGQAEGTPVLDPLVRPCHWCPSMDCVEACPTPALSFGPDRVVVGIGKAVLNLEACLTSHGTICDTCAAHCPAGARAITMKNRVPVLDEDRCVGCGLCAYHCESRPGSIHIEHPGARAAE